MDGEAALCLRCAVDETRQGFDAGPVDLQPGVTESRSDPERPHWSVASGFGVWVFSIGALLGVQLVAVIAWAFLQQAAGRPVPFEDQQEFLRWIESPPVVLVSVASSVVAHVLTLGLCWAVVTSFGRRSVLEGLGWGWPGQSVVAKVLLVLGTTALMLAVFFVLERALPQSRETAFDRLLKTSQQVRVAIAFLAVFSAPIVEEVVYRGVLYSALRSKIGVVVAVLIVTMLFGAVHFLQYWGAWSSLIGVTLLSFVLTVIRAVTRSIKPCVAIHLLNNVVGALGILSKS